MTSSSLIYCFLFLGLLLNPIFSYVVDRSSSSSSNSEEITEAPPTRQHVSRIARPGEIITPTLSELTQFFGATEYDDNRLGGPNFAKNEQLTASSNASDKSILSFNDLLTLLAVWHLANEFNNYEVKTEGCTEHALPAETRSNEVQNLLLGLLVNPIFSSSSSRNSEHISRIPRRGEIVISTVPELAQFVRTTKSDDNRLGGLNFAKNEQLTASSDVNDKSILSYKDLLTLLALWNLANECKKNEVKTEGCAE